MRDLISGEIKAKNQRNQIEKKETEVQENQIKIIIVIEDIKQPYCSMTQIYLFPTPKSIHSAFFFFMICVPISTFCENVYTTCLPHSFSLRLLGSLFCTYISGFFLACGKKCNVTHQIEYFNLKFHHHKKTMKTLLPTNCLNKNTQHPVHDSTIRKQKKSYGLQNYFNHFQHVYPKSKSQKQNKQKNKKRCKDYKHIASYDIDQNFILLREKHTNLISNPLKKKLTDSQEQLKNKIPGSTLILGPAQTVAAIYYPHEYQLQKLKNTILKLVNKDMPEDEKYQLKWFKRTLHKMTPIPSKKKQYKAYSYDTYKIIQLDKLLKKNNLCVDEPKISNKYSDEQHVITWTLPKKKKHHSLINLIKKKHIKIKAKIANYNEYIEIVQNDADYALQQMVKESIEKLDPPNERMLNNLKFHNNQLFSAHIEKPSEDQKQTNITKYPHLQIYDRETEPISTQVFKSSKHTFLFMNINGSAKKTLKNNPMMLHLIPTHKPHTIAIADHRLLSEPNWAKHAIPGYDPKLFTSADKSSDRHIGGLWIFTRRVAKTKFKPLQIDTQNNIAWFKQDRITYSVAYCRPQTSEHASNKTQNFYKSLKQSIKKYAPTNRQKKEVILVGDFNARCGLFYHETKGKLNYNGEQLIQFINTTNLKLATPIFEPETPTYRDGHGGESQIDHVISTDPRQQIEKLTIDTHPQFIGDHSPIIFTLKNEDVEIVEHTDTYTFRNSPLENTEDECNKMLEKHKNHLLKLYDRLQEHASTEEHQQYISKIITYLCIYTLHKAAIIRFGLRKSDSTNPWSPTNIDLVDVTTRINIIEHDNPTALEELKKLKRRHKTIVNTMEKRKTIQNTEKLRQRDNSEASHAMACFFKRHNAKPLPDFLKEADKYIPFNEAMSNHLKIRFQNYIPSSDQKTDEESKEHYDELMSHKADRLDIETPPNVEEEELEPEDEDKPSTIESALKATNPNGCPGYDRMSQPILVGINAEPILEILYNTWLQTLHIPTASTQGMIQSLEKTTNPFKAAQFRPITLLPIFYKIFERIILWKLDEQDVEKNLHLLQGGFRKGRGVQEMLGILRIASEVSLKENKPLFLASLDVAKAYDCVPRDKILWKLKHQFNVSDSLCQVVQAMLTNTKSAMRNKNHITHSFDTLNGVMQGSVIAPCLYGVFINDLVEELNNQNMGITIGNDKIAALAYCDDIMLLATTPEELSKLLEICEKHSHKWQYRFNPDKCRTMVHNYNHQTNSVYNNKQKQQIQTVYNNMFKNRLLIKPAPAIITGTLDENLFTGTDIHNKQDCLYEKRDLPKTLRIPIERHFKYQNIFNIDTPYDVHWNNIEDNYNIKQQLEQVCTLENKSIPYSTEIRYLGGFLHELDPTNVISTYITTNNFIKKLKTKENYLKKLNINYNTIPLYNAINLTKSVMSAYTCVYAQVLPHTHLERTDKISHNSLNNVLPIFDSKPNQLHYYTQIPKPSDRWTELQLGYYRTQHKMDMSRSKLAYWTQNNTLPDLPFFQQMKNLHEQCVPNWDPKTDTITDLDSVLDIKLIDQDEHDSKQQNTNPRQISPYQPKQIELTNKVLNGTHKYKQTLNFHEIYNKHLLQLILETPNDILEEVLNDKKKHSANYTDNLKQHLKQYEARSNKTKFVPIDYRHSKRDTVKLERRYLKKSKHLRNNLQSYSKLVRGVLAADLYYDIDMKNCHPTLLLHICKMNNIPCEQLENYVNNRPDIIDEILNHKNNSHLTKDTVKQAYISLINGGKNQYYKIKYKPDHIKKFKKEVKTIVERLKQLYPVPWKYSQQKPKKKEKKYTNPEGSFMSLLCSRLENYILQLMITYIKSKYFKHKSRMVCVLCFDGLMFQRTIWKTEKHRDSDIKSMEKHIKHMTGIPVELVCKNLKQNLLNKILEYHNDKPNEPINNNNNNQPSISTDCPCKCHEKEEADEDQHNCATCAPKHQKNTNNTDSNASSKTESISEYTTDNDSERINKNHQNNHNHNNHNHNNHRNTDNSENNNQNFTNNRTGNNQTEDDEIEDEEDPLPLTDALFKSYLVKKQNEKTLSQFHPQYPLRVINWCPKDRAPFRLIEENCLNKDNKITHLKQYRKLFYKFGTLTEHTQNRDVCNLCHNHIEPNTDSMEKHIFLDCQHLNHLRSNYWKQAHNELVEIFNKPYNTHQQKFAQYVLESIQKLTTHKQNFWKIASGANSVKKNNQTFSYDLFWQKLTWFKQKHKVKHDVFYIKLLDKLSRWYHITHDILLDKYKQKTNKMTAAKQLKQYKHTQYNYNYHMTCLTDKDWQNFKQRNKITPNDIVISTDGSWQKNQNTPEGRAGYGIYIEHKKVKYKFWQALGEQSNNYAEITALAKIKPLLRRLCINFSNKRIFILTDSEIAFNMSFQKPKKESEYPELHQTLLDNIWDINPTLIKITSHLDAKRCLPNNEENEQADDLADKAALYSLQHPSHETPLFNSWLLSTLIPVNDPECSRQIQGWNSIPD